jgi:hypothetical protein
MTSSDTSPPPPPARTPVSTQMQAKRVARAELATRLFVLVLLAVLVAQAVTIYQIRNTQLEGTPIGQKLVASADRILDCTDPKGECYEQSQRRTAQVLASVQRIIVLAAACAADVVASDSVDGRESEITACVTKRLASDPPK